MIDYFIPLIRSFLTADCCNLFLYPLFCLYFVASVPALIRLFVKWR